MDAIAVNNVSKRFKIPHEKKTTVFQNIVGLLKGQLGYEEFWALKDISFSIKKGETYGIIGRNGSGKSTLLKILAKVMYPDSGTISLNGKVASFLELGIGFQPELTAEENVYIYSSILGISSKEVKQNYDRIFDFAELKKFENMKLKNFSSGMYMRLAFSTAVHANPDILLIDEVLAVGDETFQLKCLDKINEFREQGKTIILVTHDTETVRKLCSRSLLLNEGTLVSLGSPEKVIGDYRALLLQHTLQQPSKTPVFSGTAPDKLIGVNAASIPTGGGGCGPNIVLQRFAAESTGVITEFRIKASSRGNVKVAIYADNSGSPGTLLAACNTSALMGAGWNAIPITSTPVVTDSYFWLAIASDSYNIIYQSPKKPTTTIWKPCGAFSSLTWPDFIDMSGWNHQPDHTYFTSGWGTIKTT